MTRAPQALMDRIEEALWEGLCDAAAAERSADRDPEAGRRIHPACAACLAYTYRPSSPLRRPGPRGQLVLGVA